MYKILHIEQSEFFCKIIKQSLVEKGYSYLTTDNFYDGYNILKDNDIDLIITSLIGREGTIEEFLKRVNVSNKNEVPIIVVSSNNVDEEKKELFNLGITDYILKDNVQDGIINRISEILKEDDYMANLKLLNFAIVDDNSLEKMIEKDILNKYGINNVEYFNSGKELFESGKKYDLYLIDIVLQNEFGKDLIQKIRNNNRKAIIIAVTSLTNSKILSSILNSGADDIIGKPIDENLFISKLKTNIRIHVLNEKIKEVVKEIKNR